MQQRNLIWFAVLSILIMVGWAWLQNKIWPPRPRPTPEEKTVQVDWPRILQKYNPAARAANLVFNRSLAMGGLLDDVRLGQDLLFTPPQPRLLARWEDLSEDEQKIAVLLPPPLPSNLGVLAQWIPRGTTKTPELTAEEIPFGGEKYRLQGSFTTRGAGVQNLTLTRFDAANWLGEPAKGKLELIPDDPMVASFLMYHYPATAEKGKWDVNPVLSLGRQIWKLDHNKDIKNDKNEVIGQEVRFSTEVPEAAFKHLRIFKTYKLAFGDYHLALILEIEDQRDTRRGDTKATAFRYQLAGAHGLPIEGMWYTNTYRDSVIGIVDTSSNSLVRTKEEAMRVSAKKGGEAIPAPEQGPGNDFLQYAGVTTQFFGAVIVVDNEQPGGGDMKKIIRWARPILKSDETVGILKDFDEKYVTVEHAGVPLEYVLLPRVKKHLEDTKLKKGTPVVISHYDLDEGRKELKKIRRVATWIRLGEYPRSYLDDLSVSVNSEYVELKPGQKIAHQFMLYHGPVKTSLLGQFSGDKYVAPALVDRYTYTLHLRTLTDYKSAGPLGTFSQAIHFTDLLIAVTRLMHGLLYYLHFLVGSYGLTIILLTVLVRGLMFPVSRKQAYFSVKMQEMAPELKKIKDKYPNDRKAQMEATSELYRKYKVNPLGSCLPLLMQMPIFLGLYYALQESIHFRLAGFVWINNLAAPDMLVWWGQAIPLISNPDNQAGGAKGLFDGLLSMLYLGPYFNLLPIFAVTLMIVQQKIMTPPPQDEQQEMQQKMMKYMMVFFGIMFYKVASGLCIYFISSSLWGLAERRLLPKKKTAAQLAAAAAPLAAKPGLVSTKGKGKGKGAGLGKKEEKPNGPVQKVKDWWAEVLKQAKKK